MGILERKFRSITIIFTRCVCLYRRREEEMVRKGLKCLFRKIVDYELSRKGVFNKGSF